MDIKQIRSNVASNVSYIRKQLHLSQQQFSDKLQIGHKKYQAYEYGRAIGFDVIYKISRFAKVSIDTLLTTDMSKGDQENV